MPGRQRGVPWISELPPACGKGTDPVTGPAWLSIFFKNSFKKKEGMLSEFVDDPKLSGISSEVSDKNWDPKFSGQAVD